MINTTLSLVRMIPLALMVLFVIGAWPAISQTEPLDAARIDKAVKVVKELCLSGTQFDLHADAKGNVILQNLRKPGGEGSVSLNVRNSEGAAAIFDEKLRIIADDKVRDCMRSQLPRIIDAVLGKSASAGTTVSPPDAGAGAPPTTACPTSSPINMVGKVASDLPGNPLQLCQAVTSVIDRNTRPVDVYSVQLQAGQSVRLRIQCNQNCSLNFWNPNTTRIANTLSAVHRVWSSNNREDSWGYTAAVSGTYSVSITTTGTHSPVRYTASVQPVQ